MYRCHNLFLYPNFGEGLYEASIIDHHPCNTSLLLLRRSQLRRDLISNCVAASKSPEDEETFADTSDGSAYSESEEFYSEPVADSSPEQKEQLNGQGSASAEKATAEINTASAVRRS